MGKQWDDSKCAHRWLSAPGDALTQDVPYRYCVKCDREEWANGTVRPGWRVHPI